MIKIGSKNISKDSPVFIIAEAGVNHNGKLSLAKKLVEAAKKAGADAIKFQTFKAKDTVIAKTAMAPYQKKNIGKIQSQYQMLKKLELNQQDFKKLKKYCDKKNIIFLSTPSAEDDVNRLENLLPAFKVGSSDINNFPLLKKIAKTNKPVILSTGMASLKEVVTAVNVVKKAGNKKVAVLHCTTNYPCPVTEVNLKAMKTIGNKIKTIMGYSDHTIGNQVVVMAVLLGARIIEKHLTLDKKMIGPDHKASANPQEFADLVKAIRNVPKILGSEVKKPTASELRIAKVARKSIVSTKAIKKGEKFSLANITIKRPGTGLKPEFFEKLPGKKAKRNIAADSLITKKDYA